MTFNAALHPRGHVSNPGSFSDVLHSSPEVALSAWDSSLTAFELRPHQVAARDDMVAALANNERSLLVSACGTGKTVTLQAIAAERGDDVIGAFFPSLALVDQTFQSWRKQYEGKWEQPVVVCSDTSVGQVSVDDEASVTPEELRAHGARVVSDPTELAEILSDHDERPAEDRLPLVIFSTYHSSGKVAEAQAISNVYFDLAILDEAHQAGPGTSHGRHVLDADSILADRRIAATATPKVFHVSTGTDTDERSDDVDMNDENVYGPVGHEYNLRDAINDGVLVDYEVHIIELSPEDMREALGSETDASDDAVRMAMGVAAYDRMREELGITRTIAYLNSRERAGQMVEHVSTLGIEENANIITGDMPMADRGPLLDSLADDGGLITNVRCLTEGVDVPRLDAVLFVDPRGQKVDIVQAVGRAIRRHDDSGKEKGHVVIPVLGMPDDGSEEWYSGDGFRPVWDTLSQMAANDTQLLAELNRNARDTTSSESQEGDILRIHRRGSVDTAHVADRIRQKASLASVRIADPDWNWKSRAEDLGSFYREHGRYPSSRSTGHEQSLYIWQVSQRENLRKRHPKMTPERMSILEEAAPGWSIVKNREAKVEALAAFVLREGRMPRTSDGKEGASLASFLAKSRGIITGTYKVANPEEKIAALDAAVPGWRGETWNDKVDALGAFHKEFGRLPTRSLSGTETERKLAEFLVGERKAHAGKRQVGNEERSAYLNSVIPGWDVSDRTRAFRERVDALAEFRREHGRLPDLSSKSTSERGLARLLETFRGSNKPDRVEYLNKVLPGWKSQGA